MMSQNRASIWLEILGKALNNFCFLVRQNVQHVNCLCRTSCVSVGHAYVFAALIFGNTLIAKSFHQLRLHALSIQNVSLCRSESRNTPPISMKELILTIVNDWLLIVNYYRKELLFRYGSGSDTRKRFSNRFSLEIEGWLATNQK